MTGIPTDYRQWLPRTAAFASMNGQRIVKVGGKDAAALLQGQLSNDIEALDENPGQLSSYNSPKGRVLAFLRVLKQGDDYGLVVDSDILDAFVQRLRMFVLRSKVTIEAAPDMRGVAVTGPGALEQLANSGLPAPAPGEAITHESCIFLGLPGPAPRVEIYGAEDRLPALDLPTASAEELACWDVLFRLPRMTEATRDAHVAQHLALDELGAVSFKKGCYTGQEIIARMKYLGKVKKRTAVFFGRNASPGDAVRTEDDKAAGDVVNVAPADGEQLILAVVNLETRDEALTVNDRPLQRLA